MTFSSAQVMRIVQSRIIYSIVYGYSSYHTFLEATMFGELTGKWVLFSVPGRELHGDGDIGNTVSTAVMGMH